MSSDSANLEPMQTWAHRGALGALAACGVAVMLLPNAGSDAPPPPTYMTLALGSAIASMVFRRLSTSPVMRESTRALMATLGYASAFIVGATAIALAAQEAQRQNALLFITGAVILSLRPPVRLPPAPPTE